MIQREYESLLDEDEIDPSFLPNNLTKLIEN
jgi:hypothetical protein